MFRASVKGLRAVWMAGRWETGVVVKREVPFRSLFQVYLTGDLRT